MFDIVHLFLRSYSYMDPNLANQPAQPEIQATVTTPSFQPVKSSRSKKKIISLVFLLVIIVSVSITVYASRQQQETRTKASTVVSEDTIIATIDGENITKADLQKTAEEQYKPGTVDNNALNAALNVLVERRVLDNEVKNGNISATSDEVTKLMRDEGIDQQSAYFRILVDKATLRYANARKTLAIDFWVPPPEELETYAEADKAEYAKKLSDGLLALDEAKTRMEAGEDLLIIAQSLSTKYPSIAPIIAVNGYILSDSQANLESISLLFLLLFLTIH
jgi:uncharacterized protein YpmB